MMPPPHLPPDHGAKSFRPVQDETPSKFTREHYDRLDQRRRWLTERIKAKQMVGWDIEYDTSERDALASALYLIQTMPRAAWRS